MTDFNFEVAVPRSFQLQMQRASGCELAANAANKVTQIFDVLAQPGSDQTLNSLAVKTRIRFVLNGKPVQIQEQVNGFP